MTAAGAAAPQVPIVEAAASAPSPVRTHARRLRDYEWLGASPMIAVPLLPLLAFLTGARWQDWALCAVLYVARMFGVTAGYHRYFSHRTFQTSRVFQLLLADIAYPIRRALRHQANARVWCVG